MANITLQFSRQKALSSHVISWFSHGQFSHVDAVLGNTGTLLGARSDRVGGKPPGVQARPTGYALFDTQVRFRLPCTDGQLSTFYQFLYSQLGKPYDSTAIWAFAIGRDWREEDSWICSELQARALELCGVIHPVYGGVNKVTPVTLASIVSALGAQVV